MEPGTTAKDRCPRCGGSFHCGAGGAGACACTGLALNAATLAELRQRYATCLCLRCLRELAATSVSTTAIGRPAP